MTVTHTGTLVRHCFALLCIACLAFIGMASFYLTDVTPRPEGGLVDSMLGQAMQSLRPSLHNLRDIITNMLLYMPLGATLAAWLACWKPLRYASPALFAGFLLSITVEAVQLFIGRFSDPIDVMSNSLGHIAGYFLLTAAVRELQWSPARLLGMDTVAPQAGEWQLLAALRVFYVLIFYVVALLPFDVTVSMQEIYQKLLPAFPGEAPRIILDPLYHWRDGATDVRMILLKMLPYLPLAVLSSALGILRKRATLCGPVLHCLALALVVEISKVFILSTHSDVVTFPLAATVGILVSYGALLRFPSASQPAVARQYSERSQLLMLATMLCLLALALLAWSPYEFEPQITVVRQKLLQQSNWLPQGSYFGGRTAGEIAGLTIRFGVLLMLGWLAGELISRWFHSLHRWQTAIICSALCLTYAAVLEISRVIVVNVVFDVTALLIVAPGAVIGSVMSCFRVDRPLANAGSQSAGPGRARVLGTRISQWLSRSSAALMLIAWLLIAGVGDLVWWSVPLVYGPRWIFVVLFLGLLPAAFLARREALYAALVMAPAFVLGVLDFQLPLRFMDASQDYTLRVLEMNAGGGGGEQKLPSILAEVERLDPHVIVIAECSSDIATQLGLMPEWQVKTSSGRQCFASRMPLLSWEVRDPKDFWAMNGSGLIARAVVGTPAGNVRIGLVHLETPREALEEIMFQPALADLREVIRENIELRDLESKVAREWIFAGENMPTIVAGDFNLPVDSAIYRRHWSDLRNAFSHSGLGFGDTKYTSSWGIRIDHILGTDEFVLLHADTGSSIGADHIPIYADLSIELSSAGAGS